ncbi:ABC transporter ATP-binding protein [Acholeplasma sp. OttesenSCG-928-E16]|nr:ABC transporter ATP-binding protein [Acholeplasma sp. OttesenSCG-928-E16]
MELIRFHKVSKIYKTGEVEVKATDDINFTINKGEVCIILGPSGAGKTTILNLLGGMEHVTSGNILVGDNLDLSRLDKKGMTNYRRYDVGFVFQFYNLMPNLTALENVELATEVSTKALPPKEVLKGVELENRMNNFPSQLSGGEQQRVSIARAIAKNPKILLCDEPTGALDYETGKVVLKYLQNVAKNEKKTVIIVTHNQALKPMANRVIQIKNGKIKKIEINEHPTDVERIEW